MASDAIIMYAVITDIEPLYLQRFALRIRDIPHAHRAFDMENKSGRHAQARDLIFCDPEIQKAFTAQANNSSRDMEVNQLISPCNLLVLQFLKRAKHSQVDYPYS